MIHTDLDWVGFSMWSLEVLLALNCQCYALKTIISKRRKRVSDILVMHLRGSESITVIFGYCKYCLYYWNKIDDNHDTIHQLVFTALYTNVYLSVLLIVLNQVLAVHLVLKYKVFVTKRRLLIVFSITWLISLATGLIRYLSKTKVWLFWDIASIVVIISSYSFIMISFLITFFDVLG